MIEVTGLKHGVLDIPALSIGEGCTAVTGLNGSGKTTFLKILAGITGPREGSVTIDGKPPGAVDIGWVNEYPDRNMIFGMVCDEIAAPLRFRNTPCGETDAKVKAAAERAGILPHLSCSTREISGGEKVMVAVSTATVPVPPVLILDEVDSHLDEESTRTLSELVRGSGARFCIWCTQDMEIAASADRLLVLEKGRISHDGRPEQVFPGLAGTCLYPFPWRIPDAAQH
jgi:energy-coupling factor transport system ATP-binding protein